MAQYVEGECPEAAIYLPPGSSYPDRDPVFPWTVSPSGLVSRGHLAGMEPRGPTTYRYAHPRFCIESRTDLGYRVVEQRRPGDVVIESSYYQVHGRVGQPSRILTSENGVARHVYEEDWEVQPVVPSALRGTIAHPEVHVGRIAQKRSMTLYEGGESGAELVRTYEYDDAYGYNFVDRVIETRPTGTTTIVRSPASDITHGIHRLVEREVVYEGVSASDPARKSGLTVGSYAFSPRSARWQSRRRRRAA